MASLVALYNKICDHLGDYIDTKWDALSDEQRKPMYATFDGVVRRLQRPIEIATYIKRNLTKRKMVHPNGLIDMAYNPLANDEDGGYYPGLHSQTWLSRYACLYHHRARTNFGPDPSGEYHPYQNVGVRYVWKV